MVHQSGRIAGKARRRATVRLARAAGGLVAGLWTGLLASPSLRVGRQGHGARADPVGQPTAVPPVLTPDLAPDLRRCVSVPAPVRGSCDPSPTVHSLWTPLWNHTVRASTEGAVTTVPRIPAASGERTGR